MIHNIQELARYYCVDDSGTDAAIVARLDREVYRGTSCGAHVTLKTGGVLVGSIVEGSEAEYSNFLRFPFTEMAFDDTLEWLEDECCAEWHRANEEDGYED